MTKIIQKYKERKAAKVAAREAAQLATVRKPDEIQKEYHGLCAELGDKAYKIRVLEIETSQIKDRLYALNQEFHRSSAMFAQLQKNQPQPVVQPAPAPAEAPQNAAQA